MQNLKTKREEYTASDCILDELAASGPLTAGQLFERCKQQQTAQADEEFTRAWFDYILRACVNAGAVAHDEEFNAYELQ